MKYVKISMQLMLTQDDAQAQAFRMIIKTTKAQRAVVVHACNGNREKARRWLARFRERGTDQLEFALEVGDFNVVVNKPSGTFETHTTKEGTDRAYKEACDSIMRIYNNLKRLVDRM
jgi:hypothetical protein